MEIPEKERLELEALSKKRLEISDIDPNAKLTGTIRPDIAKKIQEVKDSQK